MKVSRKSKSNEKPKKKHWCGWFYFDWNTETTWCGATFSTTTWCKVWDRHRSDHWWNIVCLHNSLDSIRLLCSIRDFSWNIRNKNEIKNIKIKQADTRYSVVWWRTHRIKLSMKPHKNQKLCWVRRINLSWSSIENQYIFISYNIDREFWCTQEQSIFVKCTRKSTTANTLFWARLSRWNKMQYRPNEPNSNNNNSNKIITHREKENVYQKLYTLLLNKTENIKPIAL